MYSKSFEEFSRKYGDGVVLEGNWGPGLYDIYFRPTLTNLANIFRVGAPYVSPRGLRMRLELGFIINDRERNAVCSLENEIMCCGLYSSLPFHFWEIVACCMSHSNFLPFLGPSDVQRPVSDLLPDTVTYGFAMEHFRNPLQHGQFQYLVKNRNPMRAGATFWMMNMMLEFYWYHEIGHAIDGHADYLKEKRGLHAVSETFYEGAPSLQRERVLLEQQADAFAASAFFTLESIEHSVRAASEMGLSREQVCAVRMVCALLVCYSWIWSEFRSTSRERFSRVEGRLHPHSVIRYQMILQTMHECAHETTTIEQLSKLTGVDIKLLSEPIAREPKETFLKAWESLKKPF